MKTGNRNNIFRTARRLFALLGVLIIIAGFSAIQAQQTTGSILGTVKDQTGAVISTATVVATNADTGFSRSVPTNSAGEYRLDNLPVGKYVVAVDAASFKHFVQQNLDLS